MSHVTGPDVAVEPATRKRSTVRVEALRLAVLFLPFSAGYYGALSVLAILLAEHFESAVLVGAALLVFTLGDGFGGLLLSRVLHRWPYRRTLATSLAVSAGAFAAMPLAAAYPADLALLAVAATGGSVFAILGRTLGAEISVRPQDRHRVFSAVQVSANIGAAAGPAIFGLLLSYGWTRYSMPAAAVIYCCSAAGSLRLVRKRLHPPRVTNKWPVSRPSIQRIVRSGTAIRILCLVLVGSVLYRQFYSAYTLQIGGFLTPNQRAALFWGNALLVAAAQFPVSSIVRRFVDTNRRTVQAIAAGVGIFAFSLGLMGVLPPTFAAPLVVMIVFSVAETVYTPTVSTALAGIPAASVLEAFNIRQLTWTAGSGIGVFLGGTLYLTMARSVGTGPYWLLMAGVTAVVVLAVVASAGRAPRHR